MNPWQLLTMSRYDKTEATFSLLSDGKYSGVLKLDDLVPLQNSDLLNPMEVLKNKHPPAQPCFYI